MSKRPPIKTTIVEIVSYWESRVYEGELSVDWSEAHERCWCCAHKTNLQRCHIIPHSRGGEDTPSNFVLLCKRCHLENPNVMDSEIMWDWLKAYSKPFYDTFWIFQGMEEYQKIYGTSFLKDIIDLGVVEISEIEEIIASKMKRSIQQFSKSFPEKCGLNCLIIHLRF